MLLKKIIYLLSILLFINLALFVHGAFFILILVALHLLFNETDFFYKESTIYEETDLSKLFDPKASPVNVVNDSEKAIIFVHGYPSSPATFKYVIPIAEKQGYDVFAPLLPGFGTNNDDFIKSNFSQWFEYLCEFYLETKRKYKSVYVVGLSMGGALTLKLAERYSGTHLAPDAVSVAAAPVLLNSLRQRVIKTWMLYFIRSISWVLKFKDKPSESWKQMEDSHDEWIGYRGTFPVQTYSLKMAIEKIRLDLKKITVPIIAFHAPEDKTVNYKSFPYIEKKISSQKTIFHTVEYKGWYNTAHILFLYKSIRENLMLDILDFFEEIDET